MRKPLSIILTLAVVVTMVFGSATSVFAAESTASTTMKIAGTDGTVTITTDKGKDIAAKVDTKLLNGYTIKTAAASYCFISLDDSKAIKLGQNTKVKVEKSGKKIELNVKNGEIYFDVDKKLSGNESMNIKTGNMTTGIRGTSGTLKTIKQGQNTIDLFQLFSGKTEMKANTQQGVQNIIERILGVLGIGSQTQTVTPVNSGNANAQPLESTMASAGQQIAITGADSAASTGPQKAPTFERQALAVSEFGTRSILESAAIKGGMSAGEALAAGTEQIVEQVGDLTQTLENAGVAQAAVDKIAEAAADPQTLDAQIAGAEQQAVQQTQQAEQTIEGAKEEAAKVEGTTTNTTENKVLENVEVKTDSGANASGLTLSDDGTSTAAPAGQTKPGSGSGSGGGSQQEAWLTGYTGTYDGQGHAIATNLSARLADYDIWIFDNDESFNSFNTFYTRVKSEYAEVSKSMAGTADGAPAFGDYLRGTWGTDLDNYSENLASADNQHNVKNVSDSGAYKYFALGKAVPFDEKQGTITVKLEPQELVVKWFLADIRSGVEFGRTANITASSIGDISNNRPVPVAGIIGENGRFEQITCRATIGSDPTDIELAAIYTSDNPTAFDTTYNATVTGIDVVLYHHSDRPVETDELQASNYKLPESGLTISFSYHMPPQPVGSVVTDQDFFSAANRATWGDYTTYDLAFVAESDGNESTYTKYAKVNGAGTQSVVTTGVEVSEVLAALGSDSNLYNTILWDTGRTAQYISSEKLSANSTMTATASNRAIYISGAGIDCGYTTEGRLNITSGGKLLVVKIGDNAGLTASDDGTRFKVPNLTVGADTYVTNNGTATIMQNMTVEGDFNNYRNLIINETSTDRIYVRGGTLTQERGVIWDKRQTTVDSNTPNPTYPMFSLSGGGNVNLYGGSLKHDLNLAESYSLPADNIKTLVYATLGNHMTMKAMDDGKAFTYTAPDGTQARAYKFYYTATGGNNIAGSFLNNGVTTLSTATDTITGGNTTTHKNIWATGLNTRYVAESYPDAAYAEITFPIAGSDASFTEYVAPTGLNVTDGVFADSNRANWSDFSKYDVALLAGEVNSNGIREYQLYRHGEFDNEPIGFDTVSDWLKDDTYSSIYWEPTPADAAELYNPLNVAAGHNPVFDGNLEIAATTTNKAVFISGPGIATAGYTTLSAVGSNKLFVRVGDGSAAAAGTSQTAIESANISVGSGVELINSGRLDVRDITLAASSKLANTGRLNCSSGGFAIDGSALFTNESIGVINIDSYGPYVAMTGTGTLTNNGAMNLNAAFHINSGTTLLNRGHIEIPEQNTSAASSAMIRVVGGTFTQEVPSGKATEDVYVRDSRTVAYDATGALQGSSYGSMILLDSSGVVNLNGGRIEKSMNNAVSADNGQLRLTTITRAIFGNSINIYNYSYTPAGGSALPALKASQGDSCAINGTLLSGSDAATTSDYFYVTGSNSGGPVGQVGINYISFPAPAGTYEVATNPTGLTIVSGAAANSWLAGYTGTYDTEKHLAISPTTAQNENYYIWLFGPNADEEFNTVKTSASALIGACTLAEPTDTLATELQGIREQLNGRIDNDDFGNLYEYSSQVASALDTLFAENVSDSGTWNYVAIPKTAQYDAYIGQFGVNITKAAIATKWYYEYEPDVEFTDGTTISISEVPDLHLGTPKIGIIVDGEFVEITQDYIIDEDSAQLSESRINISLGYPERDPYTEAGTYYATTSGITYTYNGNTVSGKKETANLYATDGALSISFVVVGTTDPTGTHINIVSGAAANSWLAGYTGAYDGTVHSPVSLSAVQQSDYWIWVFNDDDFDDNPNGVDYTPFLASMKAIFESGDFVATEESLAQVQSSIGGEQLPSVTSRALTYNDWHLISNRETLVQEIGVVDVLSSGDYNYFALPKHPTGSAFTGTFKVDITRAAVGVEWFVVHPDLPNALDPEWDVEENGIPASSRATQGAVYPYNNDVEVPVIPYLVAGPASSELYSMPNVGWLELNGEDFRGYELLTTNSAVSGAGTYSVTVTGIKCYDDQGNVIAEQMYVDNYYIDPATATYTYTLQPEGIDDFGAFMTSLDGKTGTELYGMFDVAYVARDNGSAYSDYTKYINGEAQETAATQAEMLGALASTTSYSSVYVDTGSRQQQIQGSENKLDIKTDGFNKVVIIDGGGFALAESGESTVSLRNVNSLEQDYDSEECKLYVKLMGTRNSAQLVTHNLEIEGNTQLVNQDSNITIVSGAAIKGSLYNEYVINIAEAATGSILIDGGGLYLKGTDAMIVDNRIATIAAIDGELTVTTVADMFQFDQSDLEQPAVLDISEGSADGGIRHAVVVEDSAEALVGDLEKACTAYLAVLFGEGKIAFSPNAGSVADSEYIFEDYFTQSNGEAGETIQFLECVYNYSTDGNITGSHYGSGGIIEPEEDNLFFVSAGNLYVDGGTPSMICLSYPIH